MKISFICSAIPLCIYSVYCGSYSNNSNDPDNENTILNYNSSPLILTTLINEGRIKEAQAAARVTKFKQFSNIESYAGYFLIDEAFDSNLFFWFFPSKKDYSKAPVILWLQGGPGSSSLNGLFFEHGPFQLNPNGDLQKRENPWTDTFSVIYLDNPVGVGFSFTKKGGYAENQTAVGNGVCKALLQFFRLFPELQQNDFFIAGESYAGKYIPGSARAIHYNNLNGGYKINLKGFAVGGGLFDAKYQLRYANVFYQTGLIDFNVREEILNLEQEIANFIEIKEWEKAFDVWWKKLLHLFVSSTTYKSLYNFMQPNKYLYDYMLLTNYIKDKQIESILHAGDVDYKAQDYTVHGFLKADIMKSITPWLSELLNHYRVLIYSGQLDILVPYSSTEEFLKEFAFNGSEDYKIARRYPWYVNGDLAGYFKQAGNLTEVLVRNSGHSLPADQPVWTLDLITKFTANKTLYN